MGNGRRYPYVRNSRHEAHRASRILSEQVGFPVPGTGVIAVMGAHEGLVIKSQPEDGSVQVVARKQVDGWLLSRSGVFVSAQVSAIFDVARRANIWTG